MKQKISAILAALALIVLLAAMNGFRIREEELAGRIAPEILRFHVRANSDKKADQELKLEVRDFLLGYLSDNLGTDAKKAETKAYIIEHKGQLELACEEFIRKRGYNYPASLTLSQQYFPEKTYGKITFPRGTYEALTVSIGSGKGHNWWCVLYPPLCFTDAVCAAVPDSSMEELKSILADEDYRQLFQGNVRVRFKFLEILGLTS